MSKPPHLVVSISGHGFGHVAQTAPILNLLHRRMPDLRLTVRSAAPTAHLRSRISAPFNHLPSTGDIGMNMLSALEVDVEKSRIAYRHLHANWNKRIEEEAALLRELHADMVFSNVGYLPLAGAQFAGIANVALCSLNWADIYRHYCCTTDSATDQRIATQMQACYAGADAFLRTTPGMPMNALTNLIPLAPIAATGQNRRREINLHLKLSGKEKLVLVSMGGISSRLPVENWPRLEGVRYLVQASWQTLHPDAIIIESIPVSFGDLLASCDALLCKPGYGSFVEAACCGVPVLYVNRPDWPESPALIAWLQTHALCREVTNQQMEQGQFAQILSEIWSEALPAPTLPTGIVQAVDYLAGKIKATLTELRP